MDKAKLIFAIFSILFICFPHKNISQIKLDRRVQESIDSYQNQNCAQALGQIDNIIYQNAYRSKFYLLRSRYKLCLKDTLGAISDLNIIIHQEPSHYESIFERGVLHYYLKRFDKALKDFSPLIDIPEHETNRIYYQIESGDEGISGMKTFNSMKADIYNYMGLCNLETGKNDSALMLFDKANFIHPSAQFVNNKGMAYDRLHQVSLAQKNYEIAIEMNPENVPAINNYTHLVINNDLVDEAILFLTNILKENKNVELYKQRGYLYTQNHQFNFALRDLEKATILAKNDYDIIFQYGVSLLKTQNYKEAIKAFDKCIIYNYENHEYFFQRGNAYFHMEKFDLAIRDFNEAVFLNESHAASYFNRAMANLSIGKNSHACEDLAISKNLGQKDAFEWIEKKCLTY